MQISFDRYQVANSPVHRLDPRVKVLAVVAFIVSNVLLPDGAWMAFGLAWLCIVGAGQLARIGYGYTFKRSFVALPFALAAVSAIFALPGNPVGTLHIGSWELMATDAGVLRFVSVVVRSWLSVQAAILLTATTQFPDLMHALRHLRLPGPLVAIVSFMYRYLSVLTDETSRLLRARESRSARLENAPGLKSGGSIVWRARVAGNMAGQLFLRSYERSDRIYNAMLARGYQGHFYTLNPHSMKASDWLAGGIVAAGLVLLQLVGWGVG